MGWWRDLLEERALLPDADTPNTTTGTDAAPGTVGPTTGGGDPEGVVVLDSPAAPPSPPSWLHASAWMGWPDSWFPPLWNHAQQLTDVAWSAIDLNSAVVAAMPPYLVNASPSLPADWLNNPSPDHYNSWVDFMRQLLWDFYTGEAFIVCTSRYASGWPARFYVVPPWTVNVEFDGAMHRQYNIGEIHLDPDDVLHLRYQSAVDDAHGHGPLEAGRARVVAANVLLRYATNFATSGGVPPSILTHPEELSAAQSLNLQQQWVTARASAMGLPAVLSGGVEWRGVGENPLQSAMADLAAYNESRIAVLLGVPPFLLGLPTGGDSMTYANVTSIFDYHWRAGLRPKVQRIMAALSNWLVPRGTLIELNRDEYVRPGPLERAQTYEILSRIGALSVEEIRALERYSVATTALGVLQ